MSRKKILGLPLKPKAKVEAPKVAKPEKEKLPDCKGCGKELIKIKFNSRSEAKFYVHVCNHPECNLYRYFQGHEGPIPEGLNIVEV